MSGYTDRVAIGGDRASPTMSSSSVANVLEPINHISETPSISEADRVGRSPDTMAVCDISREHLVSRLHTRLIFQQSHWLLLSFETLPIWALF